MLVNATKDILRAFSEGYIGWREACRRLDLQQFDELETLLKTYGFGLYQPDQAESSDRMSQLDIWLYAEGER